MANGGYIYSGSPASMKRRLNPISGLPGSGSNAPPYTQAQVAASLAANPPTYAPGGGILFAPSSEMMGGGIPGSNNAPTPFNVQALLDSILGPVKADLAAQGTVDLAGRNAAINRGLVQFGEIPDTAAAQQSLGLDLGPIISPDTAQLAQVNPYGATKQLATQHQEAIRGIKQGLAARGMLQSGELNYQLGKEQQAYGQAQYDARQKLLDFISGVQQGYLQAERQRQASLAGAGGNALQQLLGMFPNGLPTGGGGSSQAPTAAPAPAQPSLPSPSTGGYLNVGPGVTGPYIGTAPADLLKRMGQNY